MMLYPQRNFILYLLVVLASVAFFNPCNILTPVVQKALFYALNIITWVMVLYHRTRITVQYPKWCFRGLIAGIAFSAVMGTCFQRQDFISTLVATFPTLIAYLFFPLLLLLDIDKRKILHAICCLIAVSMVVYIVNLITYPNIIFGQEIDKLDFTRGIARIKIPFFTMFVLMFFYCINRWTTTGKKSYIGGVILLGIFIILSVTRQAIVLSFILGVWMLMKQASIGKRIMVVVIIATFAFVVLPEIPVYNNLVKLTEKQFSQKRWNSINIRTKAWKFYTIEYQTNELTPVLGNGVPSIGNTPWGRSFERIVYTRHGGNGCYTVDVGWAGFFWQFGGIATLCLLSLLVCAMIKRKKAEDTYLSYWIGYIIITSVASGPILYYNQIISISTVLYLVYGREINIATILLLINVREKNVNHEDDSSRHSQLQ